MVIQQDLGVQGIEKSTMTHSFAANCWVASETFQQWISKALATGLAVRSGIPVPVWRNGQNEAELNLRRRAVISEGISG